MAAKILNSTQTQLTHPTSLCGNCGKTDEKLQKCAKCHFQKYCGKECQDAHWPEHKKVCSALGKKEKVWNSIQEQTTSWLERKKQCFMQPPMAGSVAPLLANHVTLTKVKKVALDLGCGNGYSTLFLLDQGYHVIAVDKDSESLDFLRGMANATNNLWLKDKKLTTVQSDIEDYTFPTEVDLVVVNDVLPYCNPTTVRNLWLKIYNALKENGTLFGSLFESSGVNNRAWTQCWFIQDENMLGEFLQNSSYTVVHSQRRQKSYIISSVLEFHLQKSSGAKH